MTENTSAQQGGSIRPKSIFDDDFDLPGEEEVTARRSSARGPKESMPGFISGSKFEPLSSAGYWRLELLMLVPIVNIVFLILWASGHCRRLAVRNWARGRLIFIGTMLALAALAAVAGYFILCAQGIDITEFFANGTSIVISFP